MRIPPSNMGWQSTAVMRWAIFWSGGKGTLRFAKKASFSWINLGVIVTQVWTWNVREPNFSMILALPWKCIGIQNCSIWEQKSYWPRLPASAALQRRAKTARRCRELAAAASLQDYQTSGENRLLIVRTLSEWLIKGCLFCPYKAVPPLTPLPLRWMRSSKSALLHAPFKKKDLVTPGMGDFF